MVSMAILLGSDHGGRSSKASAGIRQFSFCARGRSGTGAARRALQSIQAEAAITTTTIAAPSTSTRPVTLMLGKRVEMTRTNERTRSALTMVVATTFSHGRLIHGPSTARSLQSRTRNTVALGSSVPASACTAVVIRPSGARGVSTIAGGRGTIAVYDP